MPAELTMHPIDGSDANLRQALIAADLPVDDIADHGRNFYRFGLDGQTIGFGGYELYGEHALIRSIAVLPDYRGRGLGRLLTLALQSQLAGHGAKTAYLLTTSAAPFFQRLGFSTLDRVQAPATILATRQAGSICASASLMFRQLDHA